MARHTASYVASLVDEREAAVLIDAAIETCWRTSRPVYIWLPSDMVTVKLEGERLKQPLALSFPENEKEKEQYVVDVVMKHLQNSKSAIVLVDACAIRHRVSIKIFHGDDD